MNEKKDPRFVSRLTRQTVALVLAGGRGSRLYELTDWRAKPGVFFGGKFRIIDFPLSNCVNSGIRRIGILTQYKAHSLIRHLVKGWSSFRSELGEFIEILPASQRVSEDWYMGTADAIYQNLDILQAYDPEYILILSGDHIYKMDYGNMLAFHAEQQADLTVSCIEVPIEEARGAYGVMTVDENMRIIGFEEKPDNPTPIPGKPGLTLASMGNYVFNRQFLAEHLSADAAKSQSKHDFGMDIIPSLIKSHRVYAYPFRDAKTGKRAYWRDVGTLDAFWQAHMELLGPWPELNLYDTQWPMLTDQPQLPPAKFVSSEQHQPTVIDAMTSAGCIIVGANIRKSLLFSDVVVQSGATVEDSVILPEVVIDSGATVRKAIIDRGCKIPAGMEIGVNLEKDRQRFRVTEQGVVLVTPTMLDQRRTPFIR